MRYQYHPTQKLPTLPGLLNKQQHHNVHTFVHTSSMSIIKNVTWGYSLLEFSISGYSNRPAKQWIFVCMFVSLLQNTWVINEISTVGFGLEKTILQGPHHMALKKKTEGRASSVKKQFNIYIYIYNQNCHGDAMKGRGGNAP